MKKSIKKLIKQAACSIIIAGTLTCTAISCKNTTDCRGPKGEIKVNTLQNYLKNMHLGGAVGNILTQNDKNWVQKVLTDDPGLFDGFANPEDDSIFKTMWHGEFPGKLLTGIAQSYLLNNDPETKRTGDAFAEKLKAVQQPDGYLGPWKTDVRYEADAVAGSLGKWDTWGQYHCIYGLYRWYQVTGNRSAFETAKRALDNIYDHFIDGGISIAAQNWAECNLAIGHAFALFYEETGDNRYLDAAKRIVDNDWNDEYPDFYSKKTLCCGWLNAALEGRAYYESGQPRWEGLYALETLASLYRITGEVKYFQVLENLWKGMCENDRHNTGSFGTGEGATGDPYGAGSETCNTVAWMAFSTEYLKISRDPRVADELELSFFNAALGSLLEGERNFTYMNDSDGSREPALKVLEPHSYKGARDMSCCQANGNRGLSQIAEWALLSDNDSLYLNYYGACELETTVRGGYKMTIKQTTDYPRSGAIKISISTDCPEEVTLFLRIPSWSDNTLLALNGGLNGGQVTVLDGLNGGQVTVLDANGDQVNGWQVKAAPGSYYAVKRVWNKDDEIDLTLDMSPHFWIMDKGNTSKLSVYYGPLLLAFRAVNGINKSTRFDIEDFRGMVCRDGDGLVNFSVTSVTGKDVILTDYYTAGKSGDAYVSWVNFKSDELIVHSDKGGCPIWCDR